jgi:hypothetical protein
MMLSGLTAGESDVIRRCVSAAAAGPFFPDWEFNLLFGMDRHELGAVLSRWPELDESEEVVKRAIGNSLNNLLGYPHNKAPAFREWIGEPWSEVERISKKWREASGRSVKAI